MESPTNVGRVQTEIDISEEEEMLPSPVAHDDVSRMASELTSDANGVTDCIKKIQLTGTETMCRVPAEVIRANDGVDFEPKLISIGPYHSKKEALLLMQKVKLKYLNDLLHRSVESNKVKTYMRVIKEQLRTEKKKYHEFDDCGISNEEFLKMLVLDGCFLVELLLKYAEGLIMLPGIDDIHLLSHDLMLIENQVPFSVLKVIYQMTKYKHKDLELDKRCTLFDLAIFYLDNKEKNGVYKEEEKVDHLLHLLYRYRLDQLERVKTRQKSISDKFYDLMRGQYKYRELPKPSNLLPVVMFILAVLFLNPLKKILKFVVVGLVYLVIIGVESSFTLRNKSSRYYQKPSVIPTVEELNSAGMSFKTRHSYPYQMFFCPDDESMNGGSMEINDNFFTEIENMLFYEQIYVIPRLEEVDGDDDDDGEDEINLTPRSERFNISTYTVYMRNLIKTEIDIDVLRRHGILKTIMTSHEHKEIASFFCKHRSWFVLTRKQQKYLRRQFKLINKYCSRDHNKRRAKLMEYFKSHQ